MRRRFSTASGACQAVRTPVSDSGFENVGGAQGRGAPKQMGPALLPTPLSPIRGRVPSTEVQETQTWHPMFSLPFRPKTSLPVLSPALAPASGSTLQSARSSRVAAEAVRLLSPADLQQAAPQPDLPFMAGASSGCIAFRSEDLVATPPSASDRVGPARNGTLRVFVIDPPCVRREPSARGSLKSRGQVPLRLSGSEFPKSFRSLDRPDRKLSSPFR